MVTEAKIIKDMPMPSETEVKEGIRTILSDFNSYTSSLNYAVNYCKCALGLHGYDLKVQCLYIINNISGWRHPAAKDIRRTLKKFAQTK